MKNFDPELFAAFLAEIATACVLFGIIAAIVILFMIIGG